MIELSDLQLSEVARAAANGQDPKFKDFDKVFTPERVISLIDRAVTATALRAELAMRVMADINQCVPCAGTGQVATTVTVGLRYRKRSVECPSCTRDRALLRTLTRGGGHD